MLKTESNETEQRERVMSRAKKVLSSPPSYTIDLREFAALLVAQEEENAQLQSDARLAGTDHAELRRDIKERDETIKKLEKEHERDRVDAIRQNDEIAQLRESLADREQDLEHEHGERVRYENGISDLLNGSTPREEGDASEGNADSTDVAEGAVGIEQAGADMMRDAAESAAPLRENPELSLPWIIQEVTQEHCLVWEILSDTKHSTHQAYVKDKPTAEAIVEAVSAYWGKPERWNAAGYRARITYLEQQREQLSQRVAELEAEKEQVDKNYIAAVAGRRAFRQKYREARSRIAELADTTRWRYVGVHADPEGDCQILICWQRGSLATATPAQFESYKASVVAWLPIPNYEHLPAARANLLVNDHTEEEALRYMEMDSGHPDDHCDECGSSRAQYCEDRDEEGHHEQHPWIECLECGEKWKARLPSADDFQLKIDRNDADTDHEAIARLYEHILPQWKEYIETATRDLLSNVDRNHRQIVFLQGENVDRERAIEELEKSDRQHRDASTELFDGLLDDVKALKATPDRLAQLTEAMLLVGEYIGNIGTPEETQVLAAMRGLRGSAKTAGDE